MTTFKDLQYTSDHVLRYINVDNTYKGFTWNILERCYSKEKGPWGYANNPLNIDETMDEYYDRKRDQFNIIFNLMSDNSFGFLQEIDFIFPGKYQNANPTDKIPAELPPILDQLKNTFESMLTDENWGIVIYEPKEMAIIYDKNRYQIIENSQSTYLTYKSKWENKDLLFMCDFMSSGYKITLGTIHADYNTNYIEEIPILMAKLYTRSDIVIFGGDMNHPPGYNMEGLLVSDENVCTNFFTNYQDVDKFDFVQLNDLRSATRKCYDGFFVIPEKACSIKIIGDENWEKNEINHPEIPYLERKRTLNIYSYDNNRIPIFRNKESRQLFLNYLIANPDYK